MLPTTTISDRPRSRVDFQLLTGLRTGAKEALSRLAVPAAVLAAGWSLAAFSGSDAGTAETEYLTWLATGVLTAVALMTPRPGMGLGLAGTLAVLLLWVVPPGPSRAAGMTAMLSASLVLATVRCWGSRGLTGERTGPPGVKRDGPWTVGRPWVSAFATVFGFQLLLGAEGLLSPGTDPVTLGRYLLLPALAATALTVLMRTSGTVPALIAGAAAATAGAGWGAAPVLTLTALAGGAVLGGRTGPTGAAGLGPAWMVRSAAGLALVAPVLWQQRAGAIAAAAGLALALTDRTSWLPRGGEALEGRDDAGAPPRDPLWLRVALPLLPVVGAAVGAALMPLHPWRHAMEAVLRVPVLLPVALFPALWLTGRGRPVLIFAALGLALVAGRGAPESTILAAPVALAALSLPADRPSRRRPQRSEGRASSQLAGAATSLQGLWSLALLVATTLAATYPWLRPAPLDIAAARLGLAPTEPAAPLLALVPIFLLAWLSRWLSPHRLALGLGAVLALLLLVHLPPAPQTAHHPGGRQILDVASPQLELRLDGSAIRQVVLDTHLTHAGELRSGVSVAVLRLEDRSGAALEWPIRMGEETGEWAAARPDLARRPSLVTPPPWLSQVVETPEIESSGDTTMSPGTSTSEMDAETEAGDTNRRFFAYRYRTVLEVDEGAAATGGGGPSTARLEEPVRLLLRRSRLLPPDVALAVFHVETRP